MSTTLTEEDRRKKAAESRQRRFERKKAQQQAIKTGVWDRCLYRVPGKQRYCAQLRNPDSAHYCGTHMNSGGKDGKGKRVPCPADPNHTVLERQLEAHLKICNVTRQVADLQQEPYFSKGINSGMPTMPGDASADDALGENEAKARGKLAPLHEATLLEVIARVSAACRRHVGILPTEVLDPPEVQSLHRLRMERGKGFRTGRHDLQQASIVGHMLRRGLVAPRASHLHVEMGAGKGTLGQAIATAFPGAHITMIERSSVRGKTDNKLNGVSSRARIDIRDLNMAGLPSLNAPGEERRVVVVAKHLCGVATDLALRALLTVPPGDEEGAARGSRSGPATGSASRGTDRARSGGPGRQSITPGEPEKGSVGTSSGVGRRVGPRVGGVAIATCCHHLCSWQDYTGKSFLHDLGFDAQDFEVMKRITAWISLDPLAAMEEQSQPSLRREGGDGPNCTDDGGVTADAEATKAVKGAPRASCTSPLVEPNDDGTRTARQVAETPKTEQMVGGLDAGGDEQGAAGDPHATAGHSTGDAPGAFPDLSQRDKARAARDCKRLMDRGRRAFLEEALGLKSDLVHFVDRSITPENALLLAYRDDRSPEM